MLFARTLSSLFYPLLSFPSPFPSFFCLSFSSQFDLLSPSPCFYTLLFFFTLFLPSFSYLSFPYHPSTFNFLLRSLLFFLFPIIYSFLPLVTSFTYFSPFLLFPFLQIVFFFFILLCCFRFFS